MCRVCRLADPPPDPTCHDGRDHRVGTAAACPHCGRLQQACARRPAPGRCRRPLGRRRSWYGLACGAAAGHAARSGQGGE